VASVTTAAIAATPMIARLGEGVRGRKHGQRRQPSSKGSAASHPDKASKKTDRRRMANSIMVRLNPA
jgi:hypothetical protein